jgi:hypothetical protein
MCHNHAFKSCLITAFLLAVPAGAAEWYIGPAGTPGGKGTRAAPWDIASALDGKRGVRPGDTIYLLGGTYRRRPQELFDLRLAGTRDKPIHVRPAPGERATIDGGLALQAPSAHLWVRDLEILVSEPNPSKPVSAGSFPSDLKRPWGGVHANGGDHCKLINLVVHDCRQGFSLWKGARDLEVYGCLIYDNGWRGTDRGHGHAIYTQNDEGTKTIADCIMTGGYGYTLHAYGSKNAFVNNYHVEGHICYDANEFLIGGGRPSKHIRVVDNYLHGLTMRLGYSAPYNEDCEVRGNVIVDGALSINKYRKVVKEDNLVLGRKERRPGGVRVVVRPSKYDPRRAHVAVFNWEQAAVVAVDPGKFLKAGDRFRLHDPRHTFGGPVLSGTYNGKALRVPIKGEFAAFVLLKASRER